MKSLAAGFGRVAYSLLILLLSVIASRVFSVEWYSFFREFFMYFMIGVAISGIPATNAIYYFTERDFSSFAKNLLLSFVFLLAAFFLLLIFKQSGVIAPAFVLSASSALFLSLEGVFMSKHMIKRVVLLNLFEALSILMPIFFVIQNKNRPDLFFTALLAFSLLKTCLYFLSIALVLKNDTEKYKLREIFAYSSPLFLNGLFGAFSKQTDKYMVSVTCSAHSFAEYSTGAFEVPLVSRFFGGVFHEKGECIRKMVVEGEHLKVRKLLSGLFRKSFIFLSLLTLALFINARWVMNVLFTSAYSDSYRYFIVYLTVLPLRVFPFGFILSLKGKTKHVFAVSLIDALLTLALSYAFLKMFGLAWVAFAFVISTSLSVFLLVFFMKEIFPYKDFLTRYMSLAVLMAVSYYFSFVLQKPIHANLILVLLWPMEMVFRRMER